jgi:glycogen(starch) synthase
LRVLYFVERFWPLIGGVEVISTRLVPLLAERDHEIVVVTDDESWLPEHDRYGQSEVRRLPIIHALRDRDIELLGQARQGMAKIVRQYRPQVIHATFTGGGVWLLPGPEVAPTILSFHGSWRTLDFATDGLFSRVINRVAWVTACSQHAHTHVLATAPQLAGRTSVILNGLDPTFDGDPPEPPPGPPVLLCSGRIVYDKGFDVAIDALAQVARVCPGVRLLIAGDGPERASLARRAASLGLGESVEFLGWISPNETHELVARASIVIIPSRLEGFGLVALEAALMARPVIATNVGGLPEVVQDETTGVLIPCDDAGATAAAIQSLLENPERGRTLGRAGRARALSRFSAERHADEWDALYRRVRTMREGAAH